VLDHRRQQQDRWRQCQAQPKPAAKIHHHRGMLAMSGMCMHCACHPGSGTFVHLGWPLMRMLMGVSVIHGVLVSRRR
jgi:hypothetical protein